MTLSEAGSRITITEADERRSALAGSFSMFVDSFDVYLPALVLPAALVYFEPKSLPLPIQATLSTVLFTVGLLGRPIGSVIFGNLSDRIGRKRVTMLSGWGFTVITLLIGLLPGFHAWGYGAIAIFAALRLIGGIFLAGGYAAPMPLALEQARTERRGRVGGIIGIGAPGSFLLINLLLLGLLQWVPRVGFLAWGWRIPFFLGVVLGLAYLWHYRGVVEDDTAITERRNQKRRQPVVELFTEHRKLILSVFVFTCGYWFATQMSVSFLPTLLVQVLKQSPTLASTVGIVAAALTVVMIMVLASVGQRIGRKALLARWAIVMTVVVGGSFLLLALSPRLGMPSWLVAVIAVIANVTPSAPLGVILAYLNERFPASVRASGYGIGYMFGLILPGLYTVWLLALSSIMPYAFGPVVLIVFGGIVMYVAVRMGPETNKAMTAVPVAAAEAVAR